MRFILLIILRMNEYKHNIPLSQKKTLIQFAIISVKQIQTLELYVSNCIQNILFVGLYET